LPYRKIHNNLIDGLWPNSIGLGINKDFRELLVVRKDLKFYFIGNKQSQYFGICEIEIFILTHVSTIDIIIIWATFCDGIYFEKEQNRLIRVKLIK